MDFNEFINRFQIKLNPQQEAAVKHVNSPALLLAVPGSGKTTVIVTRLGYMIYCLSVPPASLLTMTYTVSATKDMRERFRKLFGPDHADAVEFRTINGVCARIIKYYELTRQRQAFTLLTNENDIAKILRQIWISVKKTFPTESEVKDLRTQITYCKNMLLSKNEINMLNSEIEDFPQLYSAYNAFLNEKRLMDYDDQMIIALKILDGFPEILSHFQNAYDYICVDEAQDTSKIQHAIIQRLVHDGHIFMVGDEDQSIYGFRAAYPQALLEFEKIYPNAKILLLETNYRSTKAIVSSADQFIKGNKYRRNKTMKTENDEGEKIKHTVLKDSSMQYRHVLDSARRLPGETVILYRNNDSAIPFIDICEKDSLPYRTRMMDGAFFAHVVVTDIVNILKFSLDQTNWELFNSIYYKLSCGLKKTTVSRAMRKARPNVAVLETIISDRNIPNWQLTKLEFLQSTLYKIARSNSLLALKTLMKYSGYQEYTAANHMDISKIRILYALAHNNPSLVGFLNRINELQSIVMKDTKNISSNLTLSTIHSSKGLEYDNVIMVDVIDGQFPLIKKDDDNPEKEVAQMEEERRLFYVGITRAKKHLELVTYKFEFGNEDNVEFSFVNQLLTPTPPLSFLKNIRNQTVPADKNPSNYVHGVRITMNKFGNGRIAGKEDGMLLIDFDDGQTRKIDLVYSLKKDLIRLYK